MSGGRRKRGGTGGGGDAVEVKAGRLDERFAELECAIVDPKSRIHVDGLLVRGVISHPPVFP